MTPDERDSGADPLQPPVRRIGGTSGGLEALGKQIDAAQPVATPPSRARGAGDGGRRSGLEALGQEIAQASGRRRHPVRKWVLIGLASLLVVIVAAGGYLYYITHDLNRVNVRGLISPFTSGAEQGTENILMVGSTTRCGLAQQNPAYGLCSAGVNGVNSDVMMILHADPNHHRLALLSIPRDVFVPNARSGGPNKIDAGLVQGISQVVAAIEEDFGIPIQHAVTLNFDQFANIVDALGGINMSFPISLFDRESDLNVRAATCVHLNGLQALQVVRARHLQYDAPGTVTTNALYWPQEVLSDLARIRRDHEFLRVLATTVAKQGLGNPFTDLSLINSVKADLTFDQSWSVNDMANLVLDFHSIPIDSVPQLTLPISTVTDPNGSGGQLVYKGGEYGDVEFTSAAQDQATIDQVLGINASTDSMTGTPLPAPGSVTVSVMNGSGQTGQAVSTSNALAALGFRTVGVGDVTQVGDVAETVVYYGSRTPAAEAAAETVARSMTGAVVMGYDPNQVANGAEVTVITGTDFGVKSPASTGTAATTATGSTQSAGSTSSAIATPSAQTSNLAAWDPRACAANVPVTAPLGNRT